MIRFALDSDKAGPLKGLAAIVLTYADLATPSMAGEFAQAGSELVLIDRGLGDPHELATVADVERGALRVDQVVALYEKWGTQGKQDRTVYATEATMTAVNQAMGDRHFYRWFATGGSSAHVPGFRPGYTPAAVQCLPEEMLGFHADGSLVLEDSWHRAPRPTAGLPGASDALSVMHTTEHQAAALSSSLAELATILAKLA